MQEPDLLVQVLKADPLGRQWCFWLVKRTPLNMLPWQGINWRARQALEHNIIEDETLNGKLFNYMGRPKFHWCKRHGPEMWAVKVHPARLTWQEAVVFKAKLLPF